MQGILSIRKVVILYEQLQTLLLLKKRLKLHWLQAFILTIRIDFLIHPVTLPKIYQFKIALWLTFLTVQAWLFGLRYVLL